MIRQIFRSEHIILASILGVSSILFVGFVLYFVYVHYMHLASDLVFFLKPCLVSLFFSFIFVPIMMYIARKYNVMDIPIEKRKIHKIAIPLLGGTGIFLSFIASMFVFNMWNEQNFAIVVGASIVYLLGTIDDITPLSSKVRLFGQIAASIVVMNSGLIVSFVSDNFLGMAVGWVITLVWIVGIVNALNFLDGMDGLASGLTIIASFFFFLLALQSHQFHVAFLAIITVGATLGFLVFNFRPAKVYLGDGGSSLLGFLLAAFALYGGWSERGFVSALGIPVLILGVLIFDMCYITISRVKNKRIHTFKEWLDYTGKDHFHHRLVHLGLNQRQAVMFIYTVAVILGSSALVVEHSQTELPVVMMLFQSGLIFLIVSYLMYIARELITEGSVISDRAQEAKK